MKKRISVFLTVILLCLACAFPVWAETESRLADQAGLLDTDQKESLCNTLDEISEREQVDVIVVTTNSLEGKTAQAYADDYFIDHGYGQGEDGDGILFLVDMVTVTGLLQHMVMLLKRLPMPDRNISWSR